MKTVVGFFECREDAERAVRRLPLLGLDERAVCLLDTTPDVRRHLDCSQRRSVLRDAAIGALLSAPVAAIFAALDSLRAIEFGVSVDWAVAAAVLFTAGGTACGGLMGALVGRAGVEEDTHLYLEGVRRGGLLVMAQVEDYLTQTAMNILRQQGGLGVRVCTRALAELAQPTAGMISQVHRPAGS